MDGSFALCGTLDVTNELLQLRNLDLCLLLIQGIKTLSLEVILVAGEEIPSKRYNNLTKGECDALYSLKGDPL